MQNIRRTLEDSASQGSPQPVRCSEGLRLHPCVCVCVCVCLCVCVCVCECVCASVCVSVTSRWMWSVSALPDLEVGVCVCVLVEVKKCVWVCVWGQAGTAESGALSSLRALA